MNKFDLISTTVFPNYEVPCISEEKEIWVQKTPQKGDHIRVQRMNGLYAHHGIYVSDEEVIHFTGKDDDSILDWSKPEVIQTDLSYFLKGGILEVKEYTDEEFTDLYSPEQIVTYARACLGDKGYNLIFNNCEHFANVCTLGRFRSRQVEKVFTKQKENDFMSWWSTIKSWFGGSSSGSRTTTNYNYEPDKVKIAQIEAEAKIRLSEMETERVELIKQAQMELLRDEAEAKILVEEAKAKGFTVMAQTIIAMQEQLTQITKNRIEIIERASLPIVKDIENMYKELNDRIVADNYKYNTEKLPKLLSILEKYPEGTTAHKLYSQQIQNDMNAQMKHHDMQLESLAIRQQQIKSSFFNSKDKILEQTGNLTQNIITNLIKDNLSLEDKTQLSKFILDDKQAKMSLPNNKKLSLTEKPQENN
ncbi:MAG: lecithin retinol acyltransferase family protein [Megamonas funiformis]|uniref:lecithin retinol acyltransferase family protein n=1 Tax=Megamonas funiformis TaxID=437897 RepID=UPI002A800371|nr:lecithin retinol acyltransferase family protein [Megamonas funiformis]MDY3875487.1 lecithin retinol acyltransferase family protein [Megamonas funiformis]